MFEKNVKNYHMRRKAIRAREPDSNIPSLSLRGGPRRVLAASRAGRVARAHEPVELREARERRVRPRALPGQKARLQNKGFGRNSQIII